MTPEQMAHAIRNVGLEPYLIDATHKDVVKATIYAYQRAKIPLILGALLKNNATGVDLGRQAVTITGYRLDKDKIEFRGHRFYLKSSRISKIYAHDDQVGPFARMEFHDTDSALTISWKDQLTGKLGNIDAVPRLLIIPLYNKLRIPFDVILGLIFKLDSILNIIDDSLRIGISNIEWDIYLIQSNELKCEVFSSDLDDAQKLRLLHTNMPKFIWKAIAHLNDESIEFLFVTTDI